MRPFEDVDDENSGSQEHEELVIELGKINWRSQVRPYEARIYAHYIYDMYASEAGLAFIAAEIGRTLGLHVQCDGRKSALISLEPDANANDEE